MSKKRFILFALVAALVLSFAGSAFAAAYTWVGQDGGSWEGLGNWSVDGAPAPAAAVPAANSVVTIPSTITRINIDSAAVAGEVRVVGQPAENPLVIQISELNTLTVTTAANNDEIYAQSSLRFTGEGTFRYSDGSQEFVINTAGENVLVDFNISVAAAGNTGAAQIVKTGNGTVTFTNSDPNVLGTHANTNFTIRDGVLGLLRPDELGGLGGEVIFDHQNILGRNPVFRTLWAGSQNLTTGGGWGFRTVTNGTIDVSVEGSTFNLNNTVVGGSMTSGVATRLQVTKDGPGTLGIGGIAATWDGTNVPPQPPRLFVRQGTARVTLNNALQYADGVTYTPVNIADGATFQLDQNITQGVGPLTASVANTAQANATLRLLEGSILNVNTNDTDYPGYITGNGSLTVGTGTAVISGVRNDYTGDTRVSTGATIVLDHERNLGGYTGGKLRLDPVAIANAATPPYTVALPTAIGIPTGATLRIADDTTLILPNDIVIGDAGATGYNIGGAVIDVPFDSSLYVANVIDYNRNYIVKTRLGEVILDNMGFNSHDGGSAAWSLAPGGRGISTAWVIMNGTLEIIKYQAADYGDIIVGPGSGSAVRPLLRMRNSLKIPNSILFCDQSSFETSLTPANLDEGANVVCAVEVGQVWAQPNYARVWNRVNFLDLEAGTVQIDKRFSLMKAVVFRDYGPQNVLPIYKDAQTMAPFTANFDDNILYFRATSDIDVPVIGNAENYNVAPLKSVDLTINVTTETSLVADSVTVTTDLPGGLTPTVTGNIVRLRGDAPAQRVAGVDDVYDVRLLVSSKTEGTIYGYTSVAEFTVTVTENGVTPPPPPPGPALSANPAVSLDITAQEITGTLRFAVDGTPTAATANIRLYEGAASGDPLKEQTGVSIPAAGYALTTLKASDVSAGFAYKYDTDYIVAVEIPASNFSKTFEVRVDTAKPPVNDGGSSGCDAGFGAFALLAAAGAVTLLRKKG